MSGDELQLKQKRSKISCGHDLKRIVDLCVRARLCRMYTYMYIIIILYIYIYKYTQHTAAGQDHVPRMPFAKIRAKMQHDSLCGNVSQFRLEPGT